MADTALAVALRSGLDAVMIPPDEVTAVVTGLGRRNPKGLNDQITESAKAMLAASIPPAVQVQVFLHAFGAEIGRGGGGGGEQPECPWCGAIGGGGHGGLCPGPALGYEPV
jgi:hypothetical protein